MPNQRRVIQFIRGFSLIELMVVIAIVGILAAIALPSYTDYVRKSRRADGVSAIMGLMLAQQKFRGNCTQYAQATGNTDVCDNATPTNNMVTYPSNSSDGYYKLALSGGSATGYTITATPTPQGGQIQDPCQNFVLTVAGGTPPAKTISGNISADRCWQR